MIHAPNTLGVPVRKAAIHWIHHLDQLEGFISRVSTEERIFHFLGDGSNVVLMPELQSELCYVRIRGCSIQDETDEDAIVRVAAGENWHEFVRWTVAQGLSGIENLALIPGRAGAAPVQNIGAYGTELSEVFECAEVYDIENRELKIWTKADCGFGYRQSHFKNMEAGKLLIVAISLRLSKTFRAPLHYPDVQTELRRWGRDRPSGAELLDAIIRIRRRKLPDVRHVGNVGSFFKNPIVSKAHYQELEAREPGWVHYPVRSSGDLKLAAAQLIDRANVEPMVRGKVGLWPRQPLVLFNRSYADGADFLEVAELIRTQVLDLYGIDLELEPSIIS